VLCPLLVLSGARRGPPTGRREGVEVGALDKLDALKDERLAEGSIPDPRSIARILVGPLARGVQRPLEGEFEFVIDLV
jgi:hypothetical protein